MSLKFLVLLTFISCSLSGNRKEISSSDCSDSLVKGYLIRKVKKDEIESIQRNKQLKEQGKSYEQSVDYYEETFFIPIDSLSDTRSLSGVLDKGINFYDKQAFFFPSKETSLYIQKFCGRELGVNKSESLLTDKYFTTNSQDRMYLYNIKLLECEAVHVQVENNHLNKVYLSLRYRIDNSLKFFDCYFVHTIKARDQQMSLDTNISEWTKSE